MQIATIVLSLSKEQTVQKENVTPAEAAFYVAEHNKNVGGNPVKVIGEVEEVERTSKQEIERLYRKFPANKIKLLYPNTLANVPETFEIAGEVGAEMKFPTGKLMEFDAATA